MTKSIKVLAAVLLAVIALGVSTAFAQDAGSITGTVKETQGAVLPGASVTVSNPERGINETVITNEDGVFVFPQLPPGTYTISISLQGFKKTEKSNIFLSTRDKLNAGDFIMEVGDITATVEVSADVGQLQVQTESGERSDLVTGKQLRNIGINGRNAIDMAKLVPGVISGGPSSPSGSSTVTNITGSFTINGTRNTMHEYTVDGVTNYNLGNNTGALVSINPDALEEVKILTSNYQAEYGRSGGGVISLTTRSGTNQYHGSARYFRRHDSWNANSFFNNVGGRARSLYRFNYYGFDIGGPIVIPRFGEGGSSYWSGKDRLFFFFNQEYYDQLVPQNAVNIRVPTLAERNGDFSQTRDGNNNPIVIRDPRSPTLQQFSGNVIPASRFYGPGQAILNLFPLPNTTAGGNVYNYTSQVSSSYPRRENVLRVDWNVASRTSLSARWIYNYDNQRFSYGTTTASWNWPLTTTERKNGPGNILSFNLSHGFSSTLVNEFIFGVGRGGVKIAPADDKATRAVTGINTPLLFPDANTAGLIPSIITGGIAGIPDANIANTSVFGTFDQSFAINQFMDNLTWVRDNHTFKFGFYFQRASNQSNSQNRVQSDINFAGGTNNNNPINTNYTFSNILLGVYNSYTQASTKINQKYLYHDVSFYVQDTWKLTRRLTLDLGARFSYYEPYHNTLGPESFFNPALYNPARAPRIYRPICVGQATPCSLGQPAYRAFDPANPGVFVSGTLAGKLVPNTGDLTNGLGLTTNGYPEGGIDKKSILPQPRLGFAWDVTGSGRMVVRGGAGAFYDRYRSDVTGTGAANQPFAFNPTLNFGFLQDIQSGGSNVLSPSTVTGTDQGGDWPVVYNYSLGLQREIFKDTVIDVAYVGSQSRHLPRRRNLNAIEYGTTFQSSAQDPTRYANGVIPATEPNLPSAHRAAGLSFSGVNALSVDFLRPYQGYADILYNSFDANSTYNSLQVSLQRRFGRNLSFGAAYTLSRVETTVSDENTVTHVSDPGAYDYALATFDRTHFFTASYVWNLPKGSRLLGNNWLTRTVFDNWTLSGISTIASGNPAELTISITGVDAGNRILGAYSAGNLSGQQPRFLLNGNPQNAPNEINLAAFVLPGINDRGPYPRFYLRNPGIHNHDLSILKNFPIGNEGKRYLQLRFEIFNFLNHTQFSGVNRTVNLTTSPTQTGGVFNNYPNLQIATRPATGPGSTSVLGNFFGEYNAARDPRIIQVAAKFYF